MRIFTVSDIHIDYEVNKNWLNSLSCQDYQNDILILSGDISNKIALIEYAFEVICSKFKEVFFVPGNHDLWVKQKKETSIERFFYLQQLARKYSIQTTCKIFEKFAVVPILCWYDFSFGTPQKRLLNTWGDFFRCDWEERDLKEVNHYFLEQNDFPESLEGKRIVSFSHFLPRIDIMPFGKKMTSFLAPVLGTEKLEKIIRKWPTHVHIYGHSHVNNYLVKDEVLYINNAFGYPSETHITTKKLLDITYDILHRCS